MTVESFGAVNLAELAVTVAVTGVLATFALSPLRARVPPGSFRVRRIDGAILAGQLVCLGFWVHEREMPDGWADWSLRFGVGGGLLALWWLLGVLRLSRAGVGDPLRRAVILGVAVPASYGWGIAGLLGISLVFFVIGMFTPFGLILLLPVAAVIVPVGWMIVRLARWARNEPNPQPSAGMHAARWALTMWAGVICVWLISDVVRTGAEDYYVAQARRFQQRMRKEADVPALREWMRSRLAASLSSDRWMSNVNGENREFPRDWPDALRRLRPGYVDLGDGSLRLTWGGGFGHWGIVVSSDPKAPTPRSDNQQFTLPLADGAHVWHEVQ